MSLTTDELSQLLLQQLNISNNDDGGDGNGIDSFQFATKYACDAHQKVVGIIKSLQSQSIITVEQMKREKFSLTNEGTLCVMLGGSHEYLIWQMMSSLAGDNNGTIDRDTLVSMVVDKVSATVKQLQQQQQHSNDDDDTGGGTSVSKGTAAASSQQQQQLPDSKAIVNLGIGKAMAKKWISQTKDTTSGKLLLKPNAGMAREKVVDEVGESLRLVASGKVDQLTVGQKSELTKRRLLIATTETGYRIHKGESFTTNVVKADTDLTPEMITTGDWRQRQFKEYNFNAKGIAPDCGHLHPLLKVREQFRQIFFELGFQEMPTNNYVENSFWNFDTLYVPQQHPARDLQDTFFLSDPATSTVVPEEYMKRVRMTHENGGDCGSIGYQYQWKESETHRNVLRTHTTAVSARMLYSVGQAYQQQLRDFVNSAPGDADASSPKSLPTPPSFKPVKFFSIDKVFRNETLDATHLAEFHQIEGVAADRNLSLGHLMGLIKQFFAKLGIHDLRFKPTYNPYTEPSMEMYSWHAGLRKWVEIGNSGVFRPEMIQPMGLPPDVNVLGWGLGLERPTMIKYGIDNIRDLVGHRVDLRLVYDSPVCMWEERKYTKKENDAATAAVATAAATTEVK